MATSNEKQLDEIKRLLMVLLFKLGSTSEEVALALNVDSSRVRQIMSAKKIERIFDRKSESRKAEK
jgi:DNA-directed RNA polymerase specialized sigma subunit